MSKIYFFTHKFSEQIAMFYVRNKLRTICCGGTVDVDDDRHFSVIWLKGRRAGNRKWIISMSVKLCENLKFQSKYPAIKSPQNFPLWTWKLSRHFSTQQNAFRIAIRLKPLLKFDVRTQSSLHSSRSRHQRNFSHSQASLRLLSVVDDFPSANKVPQRETRAKLSFTFSYISRYQLGRWNRRSIEAAAKQFSICFPSLPISKFRLAFLTQLSFSLLELNHSSSSMRFPFTSQIRSEFTRMKASAFSARHPGFNYTILIPNFLFVLSRCHWFSGSSLSTAKCILINQLNTRFSFLLLPILFITLKTIEKAKEELFKQHFPPPQTSFEGSTGWRQKKTKSKKFFRKTTNFLPPVFSVVCFCFFEEGGTPGHQSPKEKQMGKLCAVLITFSPSSGPSISTISIFRRKCPLGEIKFHFFSFPRVYLKLLAGNSPLRPPGAHPLMKTTQAGSRIKSNCVQQADEASGENCFKNASSRLEDFSWRRAMKKTWK